MTTSATPPETSSESAQPVVAPQEILVQEPPVAEMSTATPVVVTAVPAPAPVKTIDPARPIIPPSPATVPFVNGVPPKTSQRLVSLDALRGFDMFWIIGADALVQSICTALADSKKHPIAAKWALVIREQMDHVDWRGFHFYDLIFPMFVFIVGASLVFSLSKAMDRGGKARAIRRVIIRGIVLYLFGIIYYGGVGMAYGQNFSKHHHVVPPEGQNAFLDVIADIRFMGVLQRIAISYTFAGLLFCFLRFRPLALMFISAGLLLLYWFLVGTFHPGRNDVSYEKEGQNLANYVDVHYLPGFKWDGDHDPEGLLSSIPAVGGCLIGVLAGLVLQSSKIGGYQKAGILVVGGALLILLGMVWGGIPINLQEGGWTIPETAQIPLIKTKIMIPVIKKIWSSSFVLLTAGCASVLLGAFYLVVDVWKLRILVAPFVWIGMNAITLYLVWHFTEDMEVLSKRIAGGDGSELGRHLPPHAAAIAQAAVGLLLILALARFLYKRQIFLRV
jgi:predicted acyltransferase